VEREFDMLIGSMNDGEFLIFKEVVKWVILSDMEEVFFNLTGECL